MFKHGMLGLALLALAGSASAQDPVAALDHLVVNLNTTVNALLMGDATQTAVNVDNTAETLIGDLTVGTPLEPLGETGIGLSHTIGSVAVGVTPTVDAITKPVAKLGTPVTEPVIKLTDSLLGNGLSGLGTGGPLPDLSSLGLPLDALDPGTVNSLASNQTLPGL